MNLKKEHEKLFKMGLEIGENGTDNIAVKFKMITTELDISYNLGLAIGQIARLTKRIKVLESAEIKLELTARHVVR